MAFPRGQQARNFKDHAGEKYGRLHVLAPIHRRKPSGKKVVDWLCRCECGNESRQASADLRSGKAKSCGCYKTELMVARNTTHGRTGSPEFWIWCGMIDRCERPGNKSYKNYGGRGIKICERWRSSFGAFLSDMGPRPTSKHTIERVNNDDNYQPNNCCWLPKRLQSKNRRPFKRAA